jgi:hypothetical protein
LYSSLRVKPLPCSTCLCGYTHMFPTGERKGLTYFHSGFEMTLKFHASARTCHDEAYFKRINTQFEKELRCMFLKCFQVARHLKQALPCFGSSRTRSGL